MRSKPGNAGPCGSGRRVRLGAFLALLALPAASCSTTAVLQRDYRVPQHAIFVREDGEPASVVEDHWEALPLRSEQLSDDVRVGGVFAIHANAGEARARELRESFQAYLRQYGQARVDANGDLSPTLTPPNYDYPTYLRHLFASLEHSGRSHVLLFIHGGRVSLATAIGGTEGLIAAFMGAPGTPADRLAEDVRDTYPLCINYEADDLSGYWEHVKYLRPDRRSWPARSWSWVKVPLRFGADVGAGVTRIPLTYYQDLTREISGLQYRNNHYYVKPDTIWNPGTGPSYMIGDFRERTSTSLLDAALIPSASVVRTTWSTLITTLGPGEWESFRRRTTAMFTPDWSFSSGIAERVPGSSRDGPVYLLLRGLAAWQAAQPGRRITLIGHSTGTIVAAELLGRVTEDPQGIPLQIDDVVFMAAACTIREYVAKVQPYLEQHPDTRFFNLCLHPAGDIRESLLPQFAPIFYRGSLLTWLDDFLAPTGGTLDRTMGRFENIMVARDHISQAVAGRVYLRALGYAERGGESVAVRGIGDGADVRTVRVPVRPYPRKHGQFGDVRMRFWEPAFWWPDSLALERRPPRAPRAVASAR